MNKTRLEAFSDGVFAIIITILVLELKVPHGDELADLGPMCPTFIAYVSSFLFAGIYWANHHHMLHATKRINGKILWANLVLLFWLSLTPFTTAWMGESHFAPVPMAVYGFVLWAAGVAYVVMQALIIADQGKDSELAAAVGRDVKGKLSAVLLLASIGLAFVHRLAAGAIFVLIALMWLVPDRRIERHVKEAPADDLLRLSGPAHPAKHRANPREHLAEVEWFDHVGVGAGLERGDALLRLAPRGEHHHADLGALAADRAADREAVEAGQHPVEEHEIAAARPRHAERFVTGATQGHGVTLLAERAQQQAPELRVVLGHEHRRHPHAP